MTIARARYIATQQVVLYTPYGFVEQTHDEWGLGGEEWQTHRSGWLPKDFPDAKIQYYYGEDPQMCCSGFQGGIMSCGCRGLPVDPPEGFFAIWTAVSCRCGKVTLADGPYCPHCGEGEPQHRDKATT